MVLFCRLQGLYKIHIPYDNSSPQMCLPTIPQTCGCPSLPHCCHRTSFSSTTYYGRFRNCSTISFCKKTSKVHWTHSFLADAPVSILTALPTCDSSRTSHVHRTSSSHDTPRNLQFKQAISCQCDHTVTSSAKAHM